MDCHHFRSQHLAFLDDTLPDTELVAMQRHLLECEACARHDTAVRRGLLIFRNLPTIEPSADFAARLEMRLRSAVDDGAEVPDWTHVDGTSRRRPATGRMALAAAGLLVFGYGANTVIGWNSVPRDVILPPVVAMTPEPLPQAPLASHALVN
jgi:anti-sigma factor RsiW